MTSSKIMHLLPAFVLHIIMLRTGYRILKGDRNACTLAPC